MGLELKVVTHPKPIAGTNCTIGHYYRRASEPNKVYICSRDTSLDVWSTEREYGVKPTLIKPGVMLVSLRHGNRMTANMTNVDFIEVNMVMTATDVTLK